MNRWYVVTVMAAFALAIPAAYRASPPIEAEPVQQADVITGPNYLYIEEFEIAPGQIPSEAIAEITEWVRIMREGGELTSVRLFIHNTGPRFALYLLIETDNWQSLEAGFEKLLAALPDFMDEPFRWGRHSDNLLSEILVE